MIYLPQTKSPFGTVGHSIPNDDVVADRNVQLSPSTAAAVNSAADQLSTVPAVASDSGFRLALLLPRVKTLRLWLH